MLTFSCLRFRFLQVKLLETKLESNEETREENYGETQLESSEGTREQSYRETKLESNKLTMRAKLWRSKS